MAFTKRYQLLNYCNYLIIKLGSKEKNQFETTTVTNKTGTSKVGAIYKAQKAQSF